MMDTENIVTRLTRRYPNLERVKEAIFRGVDFYEGHPYAIRYFDLRNNLISTAGHLHKYQEELLGASYFSNESKVDLRWNHYLYFVISVLPSDKELLKAKAIVESDREYARKLVVTENDLDEMLVDRIFGDDQFKGLPLDPLSIWSGILDKNNLGFIIDETLQVPAIIRHIADGERKPVIRPPAIPELDAAEKVVADEFLQSVEIEAFRNYPIRKAFNFGAVNLILGVNGVGKTSLLEVIEYLFCGRTRRTESFSAQTSVAGVLASSKLVLQTNANTPPSNLRSRHLVWYGKSELRKLTLCDSFSKFNFLDTDAAVRLTVEKSRERIVDDLAQLLLGAEAAKTLDRFERVAQQLYDQQKLLENEIAIKETRRCELLTRIKQLRETPRKSDLLFSDLCFLLSSFGWINQPKTKSQADELSTLLQTALINVHLIVSLGGALPKNADKLETLIQSLNETEKTIKELSKDDISYKKENTRIKIRVQELAKRLELLDLLAQVENAGIRTLYLKRQSLERQINDTKAVLTEVESASSRLFPDKVPNQTILSQAVQEWSDKVRRAGETMEDKRNALASYERTQNILRSFYQRLHSSAKDLMQHSGDRTHCPLCRAEYSEGELEKIFEEGSRGIVTGESDQLRTELQTAVALHQQYVSEFRALQTLERHFPGNSGSSSVEAIIQSVTSQGEHLATLVSELEIVRDILSEQEEKGRTFERLIELTTMLGISETEISSEHIDYLRKSTQDEQINLFNLNKKIESDGKEVSAKISEIGLVFNLSNPTVENLTIAVSKRRQSTMDTREAIIGLKSQIALEKLNSASELNAQLSEAHELNVRLRTEVAKEQQNSKVIIEETKLADDTTKEIEGLRVKLLRIDSACKVIRALLSQQSQRFLTEKVLRENAQKIAATFSKIHSPNEFNLVTNGGLKIIRRSGGNVELDEMSSGQRAAYALSLFLSINERLRTGPRVLLFDDPVAHVDDINTLSFLDHLRDIALSGQRQIFFATADSKIGALFNRKFSFLGEKFKRIELTRD